jgi:hypothetical protein
MVASLYEPRYWEFRSEEIRALFAAEFNDQHAKEIMLRIATDYEQLAKLIRTLGAPERLKAASNEPSGSGSSD